MDLSLLVGGWVAFIVLLIVIGVTGLLNQPLWVPGVTLRHCQARAERLAAVLLASQAATRAATNALKSRTADYSDRLFLSALRRRIATALSVEDVQNVCFDLQVSYDDLPATNAAGRVRELVELMRRENRVSELVVLLARDRPDVDWTHLE